MLRAVFIALSESRTLRGIAERSRFGQRTSARFVAGKEVADAVRAAATVNQWGAGVSIDNLGENVTNADEARASAQLYHHLLDEIAADKLKHANLLGTTVGIPPGSFGISVEPVQVIVSTGLTERIGSLQFAQRSDKSRAGRITIACGLPITGAWPDVKVTGTGAFVNASLDYTRSPSENCLISIDRRAREIYLMFHGKNISFLLSGAAPAAAAEPA